MTAKKRGLGRGLDSLLGNREAVTEPDPQRFQSIALDLVTANPYQPRQVFDSGALEELSQSIRQYGVLQPVMVRPVANQRFELIAGERRWRAARMAGLTEIPAICRPVTDKEALALALIENIQRQQLNAVEEAESIQQLIGLFDLSHHQAAEAVGRSRSTVTNLLRLLTLDETVLQLVKEGKLEMGHARALLAVPKQYQQDLAQRIMLSGLSVREAEALVRQRSYSQATTGAAKPSQDQTIMHLQQDLAQRLGGAKVVIQQTPKGKGRLVIHYRCQDELNDILQRVK